MLKANNISSIPKRSPFRYPGGKTWLIPQIRKWLSVYGGTNIQLIEPFAGGGIVTLTGVMEGLVSSGTMLELDSAVSAVWRAILGRSGNALAKQIKTFDFNEQTVFELLNKKPANLREYAFQTIVNNRVKRNGILASGAGFLKNGESGSGIKSRWYPETVAQRILEITAHKMDITFKQGDGLRYLKKHAKRRDYVYFIDPPYDGVGKRLYEHWEIDNKELFRVAGTLEGSFLMTYNKTDEIENLAKKCGFDTVPIQMNGGSNSEKVELLIGRELSWLAESQIVLKTTADMQRLPEFELCPVF